MLVAAMVVVKVSLNVTKAADCVLPLAVPCKHTMASVSCNGSGMIFQTSSMAAGAAVWHHMKLAGVVNCWDEGLL